MTPDTPKKLSTLIREGAALRPPTYGQFFEDRDGVLCSCALGAAYEAATGKTEGTTDEIYRALKLGTEENLVAMPMRNRERFRSALPYEARSNMNSLFGLIYFANDSLFMRKASEDPREVVADALEAAGL